MTSITANDVASGDPCSSLSMNHDVNSSKPQQVYSRKGNVFVCVLIDQICCSIAQIKYCCPTTGVSFIYVNIVHYLCQGWATLMMERATIFSLQGATYCQE